MDDRPVPVPADLRREVVATGGKAVRRLFAHGRERPLLPVVSAWAGRQRLVLGQCCVVDGKSNEFTAVSNRWTSLLAGWWRAHATGRSMSRSRANCSV